MPYKPYRDLDSDLVRKILDELANLKKDVEALRDAFNNHTHRCDGAQTAQYTCTKPTSDAPTITGGTALTVSTTAQGISPT